MLASGHPQAYLLMARMLMIGDVYERDLVRAYAYARAADLIGSASVRTEAKERLDLITWELPPKLIPEAELAAREIVRQR
jgi:hypothetical protein